MEKYMIQYLVLGDDSKYEYFKELIDVGGPKELEKDIRIFHGSGIDIKNEDNVIEYTSSKLTPGKTLFIPFGNELDRDHNANDYYAILFFAEFPYNKENVRNQLKYIDLKYKSIVVLYHKKRKFSANDLDTEDELLEKTKDEYMNDCIDVIDYKEDDTPERILNLKTSLSDNIADNYKKAFKKVYTGWEDSFITLYDIYITNGEIESIEKNIMAMKNTFSFKNIKKNKKSLWNVFVEIFRQNNLDDNPNSSIISKIKDVFTKNNAWNVFVERFRQNIFDDDFNSSIKDLFANILKNIFTDDYIDKFSKETIVELNKLYTDKLINKKKIRMKSDEIKYYKMLNEKNWQVIFKKSIDEFIKIHAKKECIKIIKSRLDDMKKKLNI